ncbi:MAG: serine/threonine protein phosphatase, partial [Bacteroidetes bacterium]
LASQFQQMLLPKTLPANQYYELDSVYRPHLNVGGDYFDFLEKNSDKIVFCIGDISGKGVAAALLMANFQANFHSLLRQHEDLEAFVRALNQAVLHITEGDRFITFFVAEYHPKTRRLRYINAGHNPPALVMNDQVFRLRQGCTILGAVEELPALETGELTLEAEALLLLFTDGLIDIRNPKGEFLDQGYGNRFLLENYRLSAREFNRKMMDELEKFMEGRPFPDDFTVLTCRIY